MGGDGHRAERHDLQQDKGRNRVMRRAVVCGGGRRAVFFEGASARREGKQLSLGREKTRGGGGGRSGAAMKTISPCGIERGSQEAV